MKIFSSKQLYEAEDQTIKKQNLGTIDLMERAATQLFNWLDSRLKGTPVAIHIFCGIGNNGGDGLALGRMLLNNRYNVQLYIANFTDKRSKCFLTNYNRVKEMTKSWPHLMTSENDFPQINPDDIIIDCLFGIGINRPIEGWVKKLIQYLNAQPAFKLAVDIPSGLSANDPLLDKEAVLKANHTLTFHSPKLSFFLPETGVFVPYFEILDLGFDPQYIAETTPIAQIIAQPEAQQFYKQRLKFSHKGAYGHALIVGGSKGKMGAISLASKAALKAGAGLVTAYIPEGGNNILQISVPEVMTLCDATEEYLKTIDFELAPSCICVGMGMGQHPDTHQAMEKLFTQHKKLPFVIDADALNIMATNKQVLNNVPKQSILTPHEGELKRLIGSWTNDYDKIEKTKAFSKKHEITIMIKGAHSIVVNGDAMYINTTGNPGMATAGSGDVLSGIISGLLSQGYDSLLAAVFGMYLHGSAGNLSAFEEGYEALTASSLIDQIGKAYLELFKSEAEEPSAVQG